MAAEDGRAGHPLIRTLLREGHTFNFFQAIRLLQALYPEAPRVGEQGPPADEVLRFSAEPSLRFSTSDVVGVARAPREEGQGPRYVLTTDVLALYGVSSPLPASYTEDLMEQEPDCLERAFYDLFQHRLVSLLHRAWERYRLEERFRWDGSGYYTRRLSALLHVERARLSPGLEPFALRLASLAGLLSQEPRSAASLEAALRGLLPELRCEVEPFTARWLPVPTDQRSRLGQAFCTLSEDALLGTAVLDRACTFTLVAEAPDGERFLRLLPGGDLHARAREVVDLFNTDLLDCQLEVRLAADAVVEPRLGAPSALLGWSTWLGDPPQAERRVRILLEGALHARR